MKTNSIAPIVDQLNLQTRLFKNVISGIDEEAAHKKIEGSPNHAAWIAGHLVSSRYLLVNMIGMMTKNPIQNYLRTGKVYRLMLNILRWMS